MNIKETLQRPAGRLVTGLLGAATAITIMTLSGLSGDASMKFHGLDSFLGVGLSVAGINYMAAGLRDIFSKPEPNEKSSLFFFQLNP